MNKKELTPLKVFEGRKKVLQNAVSLYEDAQVLYNAGRYARAFFLIQISTEELGKYGIIISSTINLIHGTETFKGFLKRFRDHKNKTRNILLMENIFNVINGTEEKILRNFNKRNDLAILQEWAKMSSLYCDIGNDGFELPEEIVNKEVTDIMLKLLNKRIDMITSFEKEVASKFGIEKLTKEDVDRFYTEIGYNRLIEELKLS